MSEETAVKLREWETLPSNIRVMIEAAPQAEITQGLIRSVCYAAPEQAPATVEAWRKWYETSPEVRELPRSQPRRSQDDDTVDIEFRVEEEQSRTVYETVVYAGSMPVPSGVVRAGEDAVREWVNDRYWDYADPHYTDSQEGGDTETIDRNLDLENFEEAYDELERRDQEAEEEEDEN